MIEAGSEPTRTHCTRAPVPQPTSPHVMPESTLSHARNSLATGRLQRPIYCSYTSPDPHVSFARSAIPASFLPNIWPRTMTPYGWLHPACFPQDSGGRAVLFHLLTVSCKPNCLQYSWMLSIISWDGSMIGPA